MTQQLGSPLGPPEANPWGDVTGWKPLDTLIDESLLSYTETGVANGARHFAGEMKFGHPALMGPPGRLQGGLHCVARIFPLLRRVQEHDPAATWPCRIYVRLERALPLYETIPWEAAYRRHVNGQWWITSRFAGTDKLDAACWSVPKTEHLDSRRWDRWRERFTAASSRPDLRKVKVMATEYESHGDLFWTRVDPAQIRTPGQMLRLFEAGEGHLSLAFVCFYLDVIGALSKALDGFRPQFTTLVSLELGTDRIPSNEPLLLIADNSTRRPAEHSRARPVEINGQLEGTDIVQTLLVPADFSKVYAHGWVATHPIDLKKMTALQTRPA